MTMTISSPAFQNGAAIPAKFTADGNDTSPPLDFAQIPAGTKSLALIVEDPDAPDPKAPKGTFVHWVLYNLAPTTTSLPEGLRELPEGAEIGRNGWKKNEYGGPNPPIGRHRYFHRLYALDTVLPSLGNATKESLEAAMKGHILEQAELFGTYEKSEAPRRTV